MDLPHNTGRDIVDGEQIDVVGKVVHAQQFDDGNELYYLQDRDGTEIELKVWAAETDQYDVETGGWYLFERAEGDVFDGEHSLGSNRGNMAVTRLDGPPESVDVDDDPVNYGELTDGGIVAVDIETISTVPESDLDLSDSDHVELLCIGVGYAPGPGSPGSTSVLFRSGTSPESEADLLERFCEYVESRDPEQLLLFKGDFDLTHLRRRAHRVPNPALGERVTDLFERYEVVDLTPPGSLEDNVSDPVETHWDVYQQPLHPAEWRADDSRYSGDLNDPNVTNTDVPHFGERYLELCEAGVTTRERRALRELLHHYAEADVEPLFELASRES